MPEAARLGDTIGHSSAMAGLIAGTVIGSLISAAGGPLCRRISYILSRDGRFADGCRRCGEHGGGIFRRHGA
ncbi:hypothetical protein PTE_00852 [Photorhabdus khanii NC19]|uniref:Double-stranded DNA deaminase toxin A prePAAR motif domain-containing protein n=1 Tax=Photorhabdus khanii NC19 TaxID=1004151 RepID=W3VEZ8_9GAMM|nr:hypothetical protein PTE_00852 [Photorhabdus khanii NC19]